MTRTPETRTEDASEPRGEWQGKTTSDEWAFQLFRWWAYKFADFEGAVEYDDLAGWAWCEWAETGRRYLGSNLVIRNVAIDGLRKVWGRDRSGRVVMERKTFPISSSVSARNPGFDMVDYDGTASDNAPGTMDFAHHHTPDLEAMIDMQRLWDAHGTPEMGGYGNEDILFDDPRMWKLRSGVPWTAYL